MLLCVPYRIALSFSVTSSYMLLDWWKLTTIFILMLIYYCVTSYVYHKQHTTITFNSFFLVFMRSYLLFIPRSFKIKIHIRRNRTVCEICWCMHITVDKLLLLFALGLVGSCSLKLL